MSPNTSSDSNGEQLDKDKTLTNQRFDLDT